MQWTAQKLFYREHLYFTARVLTHQPYCPGDSPFSLSRPSNLVTQISGHVEERFLDLDRE